MIDADRASVAFQGEPGAYSDEALTAPAMAEALAELRGGTTFLRVLGSYPRAPR